MKTSGTFSLARFSGLTLTAALFAGAMAATAGGVPAGKGGATLLMKPHATISAPAQHGMACPSCKDEYVTRKETIAKGTIKPSVTLERHLCNGCATTFGLVGQGKAKHDVATHVCTASVTKVAACCQTGQ